MILINSGKPTFLVGELLFFDIVIHVNKQYLISWFELQSNMVSPFSMHQQQLVMLAQQQSLLMAAAAKSAGGDPKVLGTTLPPGANGNVNLPAQSFANAGYQMPGMVMPHQLQAFMQVEPILWPT